MPLAGGADDFDVRARAAVTAGSALRQLGFYQEAKALEARALRRAPAQQRAQQRAHLFIGLAADAVGVGDARTCAQRLVAAERALPARDWRARVRLDWVRCEHALLTGNASAATTFARSALRRSTREGALRHVAKSLLFLGVALRERGDARAVPTLERAAGIAQRVGAWHVEDTARRLARETKKAAIRVRPD